MKGKNALKFFLVVIATALLTFIAFKGLVIPKVGTIPGVTKETTRLGIDIKGGIHVTFSAPDGYKPTDDELAATTKVLGNRLDEKQVLDRTITMEKATRRIIVEMPWRADEKEFNAQKAVEELGKTAMLRFMEMDVDPANGQLKIDPATSKFMTIGEPLVTGKDVERATTEVDNRQGGMLVALSFKPDGVKKFADATGKLVGKPIGIFLDDNFISAPRVNEKIADGNATITFGNTNRQETVAEAKNLSDTINGGALPFNLVAREISSISPHLGDNAMQISLYAGAFSLLLVWIFMLAYYRLPGILANIALLLHTVIQVLFITWTGITLTLPGIAGIILTIGMGVDANVIIFERIKEELKNGKTLRAGIDVGFKRAFSAILDANMTTMIAGIVLWNFGSGPVKSFAITLILGVALSFFTAITASRILLRSVSDVNIAKHRGLYGA